MKKLLNIMRKIMSRKETKLSFKEVDTFMTEWNERFEQVKKPEEGWSELYPALIFENGDIKVKLCNAPSCDVDIYGMEQIILVRNFLSALINKFGEK